MFPEFVMCNDIIVMFNSEATSGYILRNKELTDHIIKQNEKILHNAKNDVVVYHNPFEYMQYLDIKSSKRSNPEIKALDNHVCGIGIKIEIIDDKESAFDFDKDLTGKFWERVKLDTLPLHTTDVMRVQLLKRPSNKVKYLI